MSVEQTNLEDARLIAREYLDSKKYWAFVPNTHNFEIVLEIKDKFFAGDKEKDFALVLVAFSTVEVICLTFCLKEYLSADALLEILHARGQTQIRREVLETQDIIFLQGDMKGLFWAAEKLDNWLGAGFVSRPEIL